MRNSFERFWLLVFNSKLFVALDAALWAASVLNRSRVHAAEGGEAATALRVSAQRILLILIFSDLPIELHDLYFTHSLHVMYCRQDRCELHSRFFNFISSLIQRF